MPDLRVEPEHRLDRIAVEPEVEQVARVAGDELPQVALCGTSKACEPSAEGQRAQPVAPASAEIGRRLEDRPPRFRSCGSNPASAPRRAPKTGPAPFAYPPWSAPA